MTFSKTTVRAFAASVALVAAGGTVAGAAVFHWPILGFGRESVASASDVTRSAVRTVAARKPSPRVIVKTRYVDDVVHRRAPSPAYAPTPPATAAVAVVAPAAAVTSTSSSTPTTLAPSSTTVPPTTVPYVDDEGHDRGDHEGTHGGGGGGKGDAAAAARTSAVAR